MKKNVCEMLHPISIQAFVWSECKSSIRLLLKSPKLKTCFPNDAFRKNIF